jgi:MoxR-like ATPase
VTSRHGIDTTTRISLRARPRAERWIERVDGAVINRNPPTDRVTREPYRFTAELVEAVNIAIALGRPLLLQGDPGCGKTRVAHAVAYQLGLPLERAHVKSTTRAQDLLSTFDAVGRLYDAQLGDKTPADAGDPRAYVRLGPFGRAIKRAHYGRRSLLLIDEIDKADLDFPNDLLHELDRLEFTVPETGDTWAVPVNRPSLRPIIIVTNNEEKALPPAFLRRCIYHEVRFPDDDAFLAKVLALHDVTDPALAREAVAVLTAIRALPDLSRRPGLSELIDWVRYLDARELPVLGDTGPHAIGALVKDPVDQRRAREQIGAR